MQSLLRSSKTALRLFLPCARQLIPTSGRGFTLQKSPRLLSSFSQRQEEVRDDYYNLILSSSLKKKAPNPHPNPTAVGEPKNSKGGEKEHSSSSHQKVIIFGSRLAGPAARQKKGWAQERPPEPDNCCMSGCVNCVWDAYREEVEEWAAKGRAGGKTGVIDARVAQGQGGGTTDTNDLDRLRTKEFQSEGLFEGVPVGIREFMALEKKLRKREVHEEVKG